MSTCIVCGGQTWNGRARAAPRAATEPRCEHVACSEEDEPTTHAPEDHEAVVALAWALAERSQDGPHDGNEKRRFRPLARAFLRDLRAHPDRAAAVRAALRVTPTSEPLTRERLAAALHERYAAALCLDPEGPHTWPCAAFSQWMDDAASILEALATPTSAPEPES